MLSCLLYHVGDFLKEKSVKSEKCASAEMAVYQLAVFMFWFGAASVLRFGPR